MNANSSLDGKHFGADWAFVPYFEMDGFEMHHFFLQTFELSFTFVAGKVFFGFFDSNLRFFIVV